MIKLANIIKLMTTRIHLRRAKLRHMSKDRGGRRPGSGRPVGSVRGRRPQLRETVSPEAYAFWETQPKGWLNSTILRSQPGQVTSLFFYGDESNHTICMRGDMEDTQWATRFDCKEDGGDVVVVSDGTILEFQLVDGIYRIEALTTGPAFAGMNREPDGDEAIIKGEVAWVLFATKTDFIRR